MGGGDWGWGGAGAGAGGGNGEPKSWSKPGASRVPARNKLPSTRAEQASAPRGLSRPARAGEHTKLMNVMNGGPTNTRKLFPRGGGEGGGRGGGGGAGGGWGGSGGGGGDGANSVNNCRRTSLWVLFACATLAILALFAPPQTVGPGRYRSPRIGRHLTKKKRGFKINMMTRRAVSAGPYNMVAAAAAMPSSLFSGRSAADQPGRDKRISPATLRTRVVSPRLLSQIASYDVASNTCEAQLHVKRALNPRFFRQMASWHPLRMI